ncbi:hypothetical protein B9Z19DRAFT_1124241 [Tuber borchii]|uniref:Uncharacterized protein n=1 Tax=Tuber borchii TaxID=42251 RepID=A0A2T6ZWZ2_TUBBO|nr:hypothetical protein B9Z19DRAFT_1124241 [Tuber borchii]
MVDLATDSEESGDKEGIWDSAVNMPVYVAADTEEEEGSREEEPLISGEDIGDLESNHEGDNIDVGHREGLAGNMVEVFFQIDSHKEPAPPTSRKATLEDT